MAMNGVVMYWTSGRVGGLRPSELLRSFRANSWPSPGSRPTLCCDTIAHRATFDAVLVCCVAFCLEGIDISASELASVVRSCLEFGVLKLTRRRFIPQVTGDLLKYAIRCFSGTDHL